MLNNTDKQRRQILLALVLLVLCSGLVATAAVAGDILCAQQSPENSSARLELLALSKAPAWQGFRVVKVGKNSFTAIADWGSADQQEQSDCLELWRQVKFHPFEPTLKELEGFVPAYQLRVIQDKELSFELAISWQQGIVALAKQKETWSRFDAKSPAAQNLKQACEKMLPHPAERQRKVFWNFGRIWRVNLDGSGLEKLEPKFDFPTHFELSPCGQWIFVADDVNGSVIYRISRDGGLPVKLLDFRKREHLPQVRGFACDPRTRRLYWTWSPSYRGGSPARIASCNYDGSDERELPIRDMDYPADVALHARREQLYWCDRARHRLNVASIAGADIRTIYEVGKQKSIEMHPGGGEYDPVALDVSTDRLLWLQDAGRQLISADYSGKEPSVVLRSESRVGGFAVCPELQRIFFMTEDRRLWWRGLAGGEPKLIWEDGEAGMPRASRCEIAVDLPFPPLTSAK